MKMKRWWIGEDKRMSMKIDRTGRETCVLKWVFLISTIYF